MCTSNQNLFLMISVINNFRIIEVLVLVIYEFHIWQCESDDVSVVQPPVERCLYIQDELFLWTWFG